MESAIIQLFGSILSNIMSQQASKQQNADSMGMSMSLMNAQGIQNEAHANAQQQRNLDMYQRTQSTQAKVAEMQDAGLSVGMLNGTPSTGGGTATSTPTTSATPMTAANNLGMMLPLVEAFTQLAKLPSEIKKNESDINKNNAETENIKIQTQYYGQEATARINKMIAETDNVNLQNAFQNIQNYIAENTADVTIETANANYNKALEEINLIITQREGQELNNEQFKRLMDIEYNIRTQEFDNLIIQGELGKAQINLTYAQINAVKEQIKQGWEKLSNEKADIYFRYKNAKDANEIANANSEWNKSVAEFRNNLQKELQDWQMKQGNREFILQCVMQSIGAFNDIWSNANQTYDMLHPQPGKGKK